LGKLCVEVGIKQVFASVEHPQTNGQVESANRVLLRGLKRRLEKAKGAWAEEVPRIVWAYHVSIFHHGDTVQLGIWVRRHDPGGDSRELTPFSELCDIGVQ